MAINQWHDKKIVNFVGGVGGAKLALGLMHTVEPENLTIIGNIGDDFTHFGLKICPDIDTLLYTLSDKVNKEMGWGLADDTRTTLTALGELGEETWFGLGDKDLATHLFRTSHLQQGETLTQVITTLTQRLDIKPTILPISNDVVPTMVMTEDEGELEFQEYFVRLRWQPVVKSLHYKNADSAQLTPEVITALNSADIIIFGPSNPWLSIAPMLAIGDLQTRLSEMTVPRVALTPIINGKAVKGPAAKLMQELGYTPSAQAVVDYYQNILKGFVYDVNDEMPINAPIHLHAMDTMMHTLDDKVSVAQKLLSWIMNWGSL